MPLFNLKNKKLEPIRESLISLEKDIQTITENNLESVFGLKLIKSEFQLHNLRIDTLAYDEETKSFVIIEYKKGRSFSVIDQGFAYLSLMLSNKADFVLEYNEMGNELIGKDSADWSQSRVIFIASSFTNHQQNAINFKDLPIELWEVKKYEKDLYLYNHITAGEQSESIETVSGSTEVSRVQQEVKKYTIEDHFKQKWVEPREIFEELREKILNIDGTILERPQKHYIAYKIPLGGRIPNIVEIVGQAKGIKLFLDLNVKKMKDPDRKIRDVSTIGHWATGDSALTIRDRGDIDYALFLIKQVYNTLKTR